MSAAVPGSESLAPMGSLAFRLADGSDAFVVRLHGAGFVAYRNVCPHWKVDLDMGLGDFVDPRSGYITCRNHLAEFEVETGVCVSGPCAGDALVPVPLRVEDGRAILLDEGG